MPIGLLTLGLQIALAIHAARTGRMQPWLWIILILPGLGCLLYIVIELAPEFMRGRTGRRFQSGVVRTVAPGRTYRALARLAEITPTVHNRLQLARECLALGRAEEAVRLYESCAVGLDAADPGIRLGLAHARFAAGDFDGTISDLDRLRSEMPQHRTAEGHLLYARALDGVGRTTEALAEYHTLVGYAPGEEARYRYAELLARSGAAGEAHGQFAEIVRRVDLQGGAYRRMQHEWYVAARRARTS